MKSSCLIAAFTLFVPFAVRAQLLAPEDMSISTSGSDTLTAAPSGYSLEDLDKFKPPIRVDGRVFKASLAEGCLVQAKGCAVEVRVDVDAARPGSDSTADPALSWRMWGKGAPDTLSILALSNQDGNLGRVRAEFRMRRGDSLLQLNGRKVGETASQRRMSYYLKVVFRNTLGGARQMAVYSRLTDKSYRMPLFKTTLSDGLMPDSLALCFLPNRGAPKARLANLLVLSEGRHFLKPAEGHYLESLSSGKPQAEKPRQDFYSDALLTLINCSGGDASVFGNYEDQVEKNRILVASSEETLVLPIQTLRTRIVTKEGGKVLDRDLFIATVPWREFERSKALLSLNPGFLMGEETVADARVTIAGAESTLRPGDFLELDFRGKSEMELGIRVKYADGFEGRANVILRCKASL